MDEERPFEPARFTESQASQDVPVNETQIFDSPAAGQPQPVPVSETQLFDIPVPEMPDMMQTAEAPAAPGAPETPETPEASEAFETPEAPQSEPAPQNVPPNGAYRYPGYGEATPVRPQQYRTAPADSSVWMPPEEREKKREKKPAKKVSRAWIPILLVAALLLAAAGAAGGYFFARNRMKKQMTEVPVPTQPKGENKPVETQPPISDRVKPAQTGDGLTPAQIYSDNVNAVVGIASEATGRNVWGQTVTQASAGSGFIITEDGYVVTNYHVVEDANSVTVQLYDGREFPAQIIGYESSTCDVALLKIDATGLDTVSVGNADEIRVGDQVCAIGNPLGELTFTLTVGYISSLDREINTDGRPINMLQTDAAINAGNSGGPLFDMYGNVIGITTAKYSASAGQTSVEGLGFAIPINDIMQIVDDLTQYGYVTGKPYLGVSVGDSSSYGKNLPAGAYIGKIVPGYTAEKAGLQVGDVIVGLGESVVGSRNDLSNALANYSAGDTVSVTVFRDGQYLSVEVTLDERPKEEEVPEMTDAEPTEATEENPFGGWGDWGDWGDWGSFFP